MPMSASMWTLVLLLLTLHLPSHHTRNLLLNVDTGDKPRRVSSNSNKGLYGPTDHPTCEFEPYVREDCGANTVEECREKSLRLEKHGIRGCCWDGLDAEVRCYKSVDGLLGHPVS